MSLLFNILSRLLIVFLPRSKRLNFMAAVTICSGFGAQENKVCHCFHCFPIYLPWSDWGQEEKGTTEDEMAGWHHRLDGRESGELRELVMNREAWHAVIHGVAKSRTWLSNWTELMGLDAMILVFWMLSVKQAFHSPLSPSSRSPLVPLHFLHYSGIICISEAVDISPGNLDISLCFIQPSMLRDVFCI